MHNKIQLIQSDITTLEVDAVVNAANTSLLGGGGVDGAIHRAGGKEILEECKLIRAKQGGCRTGEAVITNAGKLPSKKIIHTVGPVWNGGHKSEKELLASAYRKSLKLAIENELKTLAFPNISTGIYGFPKHLAARIAIKEVEAFLAENEEHIEKIIFICFDDENYNIYKEFLS